MKIKEMLKRVLPLPVYSFNRQIQSMYVTMEKDKKDILSKVEKNNIEPIIKRMDTYEREMQLVKNEITKYQSELDACKIDITHLVENKVTELHKALNVVDNNLTATNKTLKAIQDKITEESKQQAKVQVQLQKLEESMPTKKITWAGPFEKRMVTLNFGEVTNRPDFKELFLKLIKGLDADSINIVTDILRRQQEYLGQEKMPLDLYSLKEQEDLRKLDDEFTKCIFKVTDDLYCYKHYLLPINHFEPSVFYYRHGIDELKTLDQVRNKDIIDVGGFIGDSVLVFSSLTDKNVYTFEAVPDNFELMKKTFEMNDIKNVVAENVALGSCNTRISMGVNGAGSCIEKKRKGMTYKDDIEVSVITLDEYVDQHNLEVGLIKVDIEGAEQDFLKGAINTICKQKPILLLSIYHNADDFFNIKPLIEELDLGYKFSIHKPTIHNLTSETLLIAEVY